MKRYLGVFLALVLLLVGLAAVASAEYISSTMLDYEDGSYYLVETATGKKIDFTGWREETFMWEDEEDGYISTWTVWLYGEGKGKLAYGWKQIGGKWYYFWPEMVNSSWYDQEKKTAYLFDENGAWTGVSSTEEGWIKQNNKWYYVEKTADNWMEFYSYGSYNIDDKPYFFKNGVMQTKGWVYYKGKYYDGTTFTDWYYANPNGELATGWKQIGGKWYYFSKWSGYMFNDCIRWLGDDNKAYAFNKAGAMLTNQWYNETWEDDGTTYSEWFYMGADGAAKTGWFKVKKDWYYANKWGEMLTGWLPDGDDMYYLKDSGAMAKNEWIEDEGIWYYIKGSGVMAENEWIQDGSAWYWLKDGGDMAHGETVTINGKDYKFADNGVWIP